MTLSQYIRDKTNDCHNVARVLIDVMEGRLDGTKISHRLTAARLLTIYGYEDADNFITDNTPDVYDKEWGERVLVEVDPAISSYIKQRSDGGREICQFLIDVVKGEIEGIHVGHRVWAARELLNRAYGKSPSRPLPKPKGSKTPRRSTNGTRRNRALTPEDATFEARVADSKQAQHTDTAVPEPEPAHQPDPESAPNFDPEVYRAASKCIDSNFDPMRAASDDDYWLNYDGCDSISCPYHGDPEDPDFNPNAHHY